MRSNKCATEISLFGVVDGIGCSHVGGVGLGCVVAGWRGNALDWSVMLALGGFGFKKYVQLLSVGYFVVRLGCTRRA